LYDTLILEEKKINPFSETAKAILKQAKIAFGEERYKDAQKLLEDLRLQIEKEQSEKTTLNEMKKATQNFFQKYWIQIIIGLAILILITRIVYKKLEKRILAKKIKKMKIEEQVLNDMIKRTQEERYKENKISGLVYNIRIKKYEKRIQEIKEELPVLEARLKKEVKNK
jgi:predicted small secreted protein